MQVPFSVLNDKLNLLTFDYLHPGKYFLHIKAKSVHQDWLSNEAELVINIQPPFWHTWWFWTTVIAGLSSLIFIIVKWRVNTIRKQERIKAKYEKETLELEAKALRAQMNPHFIFNCMNSIKSLIQQKEEDRAVNYLTTFSKLLRTILHNCDKREITLFDELETCRLYTQLEEMRFGKKLCYSFQVEEGFDLKSVMVPALIMQPFIENAIWHGIMPMEEGGKLSVVVEKKNNVIYCVIDDNGIGREMSRQNKFKGESTHQSKGFHLTQARLDLDNLINERKASIEIIDKKDQYDKATGTTVILAFKEY
jgi:sensor histidine kinase YesM